MTNFKLFTLLALSFLTFNTATAQNVELIPFGDFESWLNRDIKESFLLGGDTRRIFAVAPSGTIKGEIPYRRGVSPWSTSNALAIVSGITKTSNTVFPDKYAGGTCAKMESSMVNCKVLGIVNITVMVAGSVFLGETVEPIKDTKGPYTKLDMGIPFTRRPKALIYDYNVQIPNSGNIVTAKGWSVTTSKGKDNAQVFVLLQNRKELPDGTIEARRVATAKEYLSKNSVGWVKNHKLDIHYGDITGEPFYQNYMRLTNMYYAKNSAGKMVQVKEIGWADKDAAATHAVVFFSSSSYEAFVGAVGNVFRIDNVKFEY